MQIILYFLLHFSSYIDFNRVKDRTVTLSFTDISIKINALYWNIACREFKCRQVIIIGKDEKLKELV